jgi:cation transport ATPase
MLAIAAITPAAGPPAAVAGAPAVARGVWLGGIVPVPAALLGRDGALAARPIGAIRPGDRLLIRPGAVVPGDGIAADPAVRDEATLSGEPMPVERAAGAEVLSGATSVGTAFAPTAIRPEGAAVLRSRRRLGVRRTVLASGDTPAVAEAVARDLGVDQVGGDLAPEEKVSEGADDVLPVDRIDPLAAGLAVAQRARRSALRSGVGIGLSFQAMGFAAPGSLSPGRGALVQEAIAVAVVLNALRPLADRPALRMPNGWAGKVAGDTDAAVPLGAAGDPGSGR